MLEVNGVTKTFGGFTALSRVSFSVPRGSISAIIGPNGAGKTTLFNVLTGHLEPDEGHVAFNGRDVTGIAPHDLCRLGMGRSFQRTNIFPKLTVFENVQAAFVSHRRRGWSDGSSAGFGAGRSLRLASRGSGLRLTALRRHGPLSDSTGPALRRRLFPAAGRGEGATRTCCVSCHTVVPYALARPVLRRMADSTTPTEHEQKLLVQTRERVERWADLDGAKLGLLYDFSARKKRESWGTEAVLNAVILASEPTAANEIDPEDRRQIVRYLIDVVFDIDAALFVASVGRPVPARIRRAPGGSRRDDFRELAQ